MIVDSRLVLKLTNGVDLNGKEIAKSKSFNNVKISATDEQLTAVANALVPLQTWSLADAERVNTSSLI